MRYFKKAILEAKKKERRLKPDEVGCINCIHSRENDGMCDYCYAFSNFKNIEMLNRKLKENSLDYLCVSSISELRRKCSMDDDVMNMIDKILKRKSGD